MPINVSGISGRYSLSVLGAGKIENGVFVAPVLSQPAWSLLVGAAPGAVATAWIRTIPPPSGKRGVVAVAAYRSGITLHNPQTFALLGTIAIGGVPADVAFLPDGSLVTADTDGDDLTLISRAGWHVRQIGGVSEANEIAVDPADGTIFVSDRDVNGKGALTRITPGGNVSRVITGETAEGIALDPQRALVYVGNVNDGTVAVIDARDMRVVQAFYSVERPFGLAIDNRVRRLFVVSNVSPSMSAHGGYVAAFDLQAAHPRMVARSASMIFPLGIAFDSRTNRLFVSDEATNKLYVLDSRSLRAAHAPLATCATPWRPYVSDGRLYVPCSRSNRVDIFTLKTLRRIPGSPFPTGAYPLSIAEWRPAAAGRH